LLNLVGGIEEPTSGRILVAGNDITSLRGKERTGYRRDRVGFVFQFFNLVPTLTALENVEVIAELTGSDAAKRSRAALARVDLSDVMNRPAVSTWRRAVTCLRCCVNLPAKATTRFCW
jgi:putative ABC transport system ATP-binding protein